MSGSFERDDLTPCSWVLESEHFKVSVHRDRNLRSIVTFYHNGFGLDIPLSLLGEFSQLLSDLEDKLGEPDA